MKIGEWAVIAPDGLWESPLERDKWAFQSKKEAIDVVSHAVMDARKEPKVKRIAEGYYEYHPKDCDHNKFIDVYEIVKLTSENFDRYEEMKN